MLSSHKSLIYQGAWRASSQRFECELQILTKGRAYQSCTCKWLSQCDGMPLGRSVWSGGSGGKQNFGGHRLLQVLWTPHGLPRNPSVVGSCARARFHREPVLAGLALNRHLSIPLDYGVYLSDCPNFADLQFQLCIQHTDPSRYHDGTSDSYIIPGSSQSSILQGVLLSNLMCSPYRT